LRRSTASTGGRSPMGSQPAGWVGLERRARLGSARARELVWFLRARGKNGFVRQNHVGFGYSGRGERLGAGLASVLARVEWRQRGDSLYLIGTKGSIY
jgi:hypothetical protein